MKIDVINKIPQLWDLVLNKHCAINVTVTAGNVLEVSILKRKRLHKRFVNIDSELVLSDIRNYLCLS